MIKEAIMESVNREKDMNEKEITFKLNGALLTMSEDDFKRTIEILIGGQEEPESVKRIFRIKRKYRVREKPKEEKKPRLHGKSIMESTILEALKDGKMKSYLEIAAEIGMKPKSVSSVLSILTRNKLVRHEGRNFCLPSVSHASITTKKPEDKMLTMNKIRREKIRDQIVQEIKENPGLMTGDLSDGRLITKTKKMINEELKRLEKDKRIFRREVGHGFMFFTEGTDPTPYLPEDISPKIIDALNSGPKTAKEIADLVDSDYITVKNLLERLVIKKRVHSKVYDTPWKSWKGKTKMFALPGVVIIPPEKPPSRNEEKEKELEGFSEKIIEILKEDDLTLPEIVEKFFGISLHQVDEKSEEYKKFISNFGRIVQETVWKRKDPEKGNVYTINQEPSNNRM